MFGTEVFQQGLIQCRRMVFKEQHTFTMKMTVAFTWHFSGSMLLSESSAFEAVSVVLAARLVVGSIVFRI